MDSPPIRCGMFSKGVILMLDYPWTQQTEHKEPAGHAVRGLHMSVQSTELHPGNCYLFFICVGPSIKFCYLHIPKAKGVKDQVHSKLVITDLGSGPGQKRWSGLNRNSCCPTTKTVAAGFCQSELSSGRTTTTLLQYCAVVLQALWGSMAHYLICLLKRCIRGKDVTTKPWILSWLFLI